MENKNINYKNRKRRPVVKVDEKEYILAVLLLAGSLTLNAVNLIGDTVDVVKNNNKYFDEVDQYRDVISDNIHRTRNLENYFIDTYDAARDLLERDFETKEDFYHQLLCTSLNIEYNRNKNFRDMLYAMCLNDLAKENPKYPTEEEFEMFLRDNGFVDEDGLLILMNGKNMIKRFLKLKMN